jgi:hypothetical protein
MTSLSRVSGPLDAPAHQEEAAFAGTDAMMPIASVIIVNYNGRHHLEKCIPSLRRERCSDPEIILVDNTSTGVLPTSSGPSRKCGWSAVRPTWVSLDRQLLLDILQLRVAVDRHRALGG